MIAEAKKLKLSDFKVGMFVQGKGGKVGKITANEPRGDQIVVKWNKGGTDELPIKGLGLYTKPKLQGLVMGEEVDLDEKVKLPRQLIDPKKEVMVVKKSKVIVIDIKDKDSYIKKGWGIAEADTDEAFELVHKKTGKKMKVKDKKAALMMIKKDKNLEMPGHTWDDDVDEAAPLPTKKQQSTVDKIKKRIASKKK